MNDENTKIEVDIPIVNPDAVTHSCCHQCVLAIGQIFRWKCNILFETKIGPRGGKKVASVGCPVDGTNMAPSECPLRTGPVIIYNDMVVNRHESLENYRGKL